MLAKVDNTLYHKLQLHFQTRFSEQNRLFALIAEKIYNLLFSGTIVFDYVPTFKVLLVLQAHF